MCSIEAASDQSAQSAFAFATPLRQMWDHEYHGVVHDEATNDFQTYALTQPIAWYAPIVMQAGDEAKLRTFVSPTTPPTVQQQILIESLTGFIDQRLFVTSPRPVRGAPEPCSLLVLCVTNPCSSASHNRVLAVCDVISRPLFQGAYDALRHATQTPDECETIMQVVVRAVFSSAPTWWESLEHPLPGLDAHYHLDDLTKAFLLDTLDQQGGQYLLDDPAYNQPSFISVLVQRTHHSAHQAYAHSVYMPLGFANECLFATCAASFQPYVRAFLLGRILSMPSIASPRPDYEQLRAVITTGIRESRPGCVCVSACLFRSDLLPVVVPQLCTCAAVAPWPTEQHTTRSASACSSWPP